MTRLVGEGWLKRETEGKEHRAYDKNSQISWGLMRERDLIGHLL